MGPRPALADGRGLQQGYKAIDKSIEKRRALKEPCPTTGQSFAVRAAGTVEQGLEFSVGDVYIVLECDRAAIPMRALAGDHQTRSERSCFPQIISWDA